MGSSAQPATTAPTATVPPPVPAATAPTSVPAATPPTSAPVAVSQSAVPADAYGQAASNLVVGSQIEQIIEELIDMGEGSWDKDTVTRALCAAYNNPEEALDYLYFGIPEEVAFSVSTFPSNQGSGGADPTTETGLPGAASVGDESLDFLGNNQQLESEKIYCCNCICAGFDKESEIRAHYRESHKGFDKKCNICHNQFRRMDDLKDHNHEEHGIKNQIVKIVCIHCKNRVFKYAFGLKSHSQWVHSSYKIKCNKCGNFFPSEFDLDEHLRKYHGDFEKHAREDGEEQASS